MYWELLEIFLELGFPINGTIFTYPVFSGLYSYALHVATILLILIATVLPFSFVIRMFRR